MLFGKKPKPPVEKPQVKKFDLDRGTLHFEDLVAPDDIDRSNFGHIRVGGKYCRTFIISAYPARVHVGWLDELISYDGDIDISVHIHPSDEKEALDEISLKITQLESQLDIELERGRNREISRLRKYIDALYHQRDQMELNNERQFYICILAALYCDTLEDLDKESVKLETRLKARKIHLRRAYLRQDEAYLSVLPFGVNHIDDMYRNFDSWALTGTFPFYNAEISHENGIFLGVNLTTNGPVYLDFYDRKILKTGNGFIGAQSGAGKSVTLKIIVLRSLLRGVRHVIISPEPEYRELVREVGGSYIQIKPGSPYRLNPCDLEEEFDEEGGRWVVRIDEKVADVLNLIGVMVGGLDPEQRALISEAVKQCYQRRGFTSDPKSLYTDETELDRHTGEYRHKNIKKPMPTLSEMHTELSAMYEREPVRSLQLLVNALRPFVGNGIYALFDGQTSRELNNFRDNPLICFDVSQLEEDILKPIGMYAALSWTWEKFLKKNPQIKKRVVVDEGWVFLKTDRPGGRYTADFLETVSRRSRKSSGGLLIASQSFNEFVSCPQGKAILNNSSINIFLRQSETEIDDVRLVFKLSDGECRFLAGCKPGECLIKMGSESAAVYVMPFEDEMRLIETNYTVEGGAANEA